MAWRFSAHDRDGPWAWTNLNTPSDYQRVIQTLQQFETMSMDQIQQQQTHRVAPGKLCKAAQDRLKKIKQDDIDELMSFRITGKQRVWCIPIGPIMKILWWDPNHQVYPSRLKNT